MLEWVSDKSKAAKQLNINRETVTDIGWVSCTDIDDFRGLCSNQNISEGYCFDTCNAFRK